MTDKVIAIEEQEGPFKEILKRVMRMVPDKDKQDIKLQRFLAFRLKTDGEAATIEYLMRKIRDVIHCSYTGRLYDYLKDDQYADDCAPERLTPDPPEIA